MSSTLKSARSAQSHRRRNSNSSPSKNVIANIDPFCLRLQQLLLQLPEPCPSLSPIKTIGEGTFSKVFLVKDKEIDKKIAIKHLVPTASPDRILMEVECLKISGGKENVVPLLFVHRHLGDVLLAMPYIECCKFSEVIRTMDHVEARTYMRNLFKALAHIHSLNIIHRDIKPANFLYDRKKKIFRLVDFGLAQRTGEPGLAPEVTKIRTPQCKRKLTSSDLANSMESPPSASHYSKKRRVTHPSGERGANRKVLSELPPEEDDSFKPVKTETPTKTTNVVKPDQEYYDRRGAILSARKRTRSSARQLRPKMSDDCNTTVEEDQEVQQIPGTPNKNIETVKVTPEVRRSPRKHASSNKATTPGFSKLTISASTIMNADKSSAIKRQTSFTILDPASGIPSDGTPRLQASLTSRNSAAALMLQNLHFSALSPATTQNTTSLMPPKSLQIIGNPAPSMQMVIGNEQHSNIFPSFSRFATPTVKKTCNCYGMAKVCSKCLNRKAQRAPRAGTPGFRPPEVLLKFEHQTTAVDIWAAGVILLCILSRTYPFFRAPDDLTALAELLALFGTKAVQETANQYGKRLICSEQVPGQDLQLLCQTLAERKPSEYKNPEPGSSQCLATEQAVDLLRKILSLSSHERLTAKDALQHPFFED